MKLEIGNTIRWTSASSQELRKLGITSQVNEGYIKDIVLDLNAAGKTIPWIIIRYENDTRGVKMCATDDYLKMMKVEVVDEEFA